MVDELVIEGCNFETSGTRKVNGYFTFTVTRQPRPLYGEPEVHLSALLHDVVTLELQSVGALHDVVTFICVGSIPGAWLLT